MNKVICVLAAVVAMVGCGGKGGDKDTRAGASPDTVGATLAVAQTFTDTRDGKTYRTVKIGEQVWMAENLNFETDSSWCYDDNPDNCKKYGRLYSWDVAMKACPVGWHLPNRQEWNESVNFAGGDEAGTKLISDSPDRNGTDEFAFSALPGGARYIDGDFYNLGSLGYWWTATEYGSFFAYYRYMLSGFTNVGAGDYYKSYGFSVRCLLD